MQNKEKGTGEGRKEVFIVYLEDDNSPVSSYVRVLEKGDGFITFQTTHNIITIPTSRVIKIKEKRENA